MLSEFLSLFLLGLFLLVNVLILLGRAFRSLTGTTWKKILRLNLPENEKRGWERLYTVIWLAVGLGAFITLWGWSLTRVVAAIFGFLAFRSGANVTRTLVYGFHDRRIIEEHGGGEGILGVMARATQLSLLLEIVFIVAFALAYKVFSVAVNPGVGANTFILYLWLAGLLFGAVFGWLITRNNRGILLRNIIATVGFFAVRKGKTKADETAKTVKKVPDRLRSKVPKLGK